MRNRERLKVERRFLGRETGGIGESVFSGYRVSTEDDKKVLELGGGDGRQARGCPWPLKCTQQQLRRYILRYVYFTTI